MGAQRPCALGQQRGRRDTLADFGRGPEINDWVLNGVKREEVAERLRPLLERPFELVLPRGAPTDRAALERALS
jgi:hypothetical protein